MNISTPPALRSPKAQIKAPKGSCKWHQPWITNQRDVLCHSKKSKNMSIQMSISQVTVYKKRLILTKWVQSCSYVHDHLAQGAIVRNYDIKALWSKVLRWVQLFEEWSNKKGWNTPSSSHAMISTNQWNRPWAVESFKEPPCQDLN